MNRDRESSSENGNCPGPICYILYITHQKVTTMYKYVQSTPICQSGGASHREFSVLSQPAMPENDRRRNTEIVPSTWMVMPVEWILH
jgi:hypothetical protein